MADAYILQAACRVGMSVRIVVHKVVFTTFGELFQQTGRYVLGVSTYFFRFAPHVSAQGTQGSSCAEAGMDHWTLLDAMIHVRRIYTAGGMSRGHVSKDCGT